MSALPYPPPRSLAVQPLELLPAPTVWDSRTGYAVNTLVSYAGGVYRCIVPVAPAPSPAPANAPPQNNSFFVLATAGDPYFVEGTAYIPGDVVTYTASGLVDSQFYMCLVATSDSPSLSPQKWKALGTGVPVPDPVVVTSASASGITVTESPAGTFSVATALTAGYGLASAPGAGTALALSLALAGSVGTPVAASGQFVGQLPIPVGVTVTANSVYLVVPLSSTTSGVTNVASGWHLEWNPTPGRWEIYVDVPTAGDLTKTIQFGWALVKV
jgi:hypothetical protein